MPVAASNPTTSSSSGDVSAPKMVRNSDRSLSRDLMVGYGDPKSSERLPEVNHANTTELSTSLDSGNASGSDMKQTADGALDKPTAESNDRSSGYESSTSSERVPESTLFATTKSPTSSDTRSKRLPTHYLVLVVIALFIINGFAIWACIYIFCLKNRYSEQALEVIAC
nr:unknown [Hyposoter didymator ichnovirus]